MKSAKSMPVISKVDADAIRTRAQAQATLNRSQSLLSNTAMKKPAYTTDTLTNVILQTPFMAIPGINSQLRGFTRTYSQFRTSSFAGGLSSYGSFSQRPGMQRQSTSDSVSQAFSSVSIEDRSEDEELLRQYNEDMEYPEFGEIDIEDIPDELLTASYTPSLAYAVGCAVLSSFQVGFNSGILNVPQAVISNFLSLSSIEWSIIVSFICIGGLIGSYGGGHLADRIGRKNFLVTNNVFFIIGGLLQSVASNFFMLAFGRLLVGIGCGGVTVVVPLYLGEISPAALRGSIGTMNQFAVVTGILVAILIGKPFIGVDSGPEDWRYLLGLILVPSLLQIILSAFLLESPLWLVLQGGSKSMVLAEEILVSLRGCDNVNFDLELMERSRDQVLDNPDEAPQAKQSTLELFLAPQNRTAILIGFSLQVAQQFSGINAVFYYSTSFFESANVKDPWMGSVLASVVNVASTALALQLMDRFGRKTLMMVSSIGMAVASALLTIALSADSKDPLVSYSAVVTILLFVTFFELGMGPIPWLIGAELYSPQVRSRAMSISSVINWLSNFLVGALFPVIALKLNNYSFVPFCIAMVLCAIFTATIVPETKDKSFEEIQDDLDPYAAEKSLDDNWDISISN